MNHNLILYIHWQMKYPKHISSYPRIENITSLDSFSLSSFTVAVKERLNLFRQTYIKMEDMTPKQILFNLAIVGRDPD